MGGPKAKTPLKKTPLDHSFYRQFTDLDHGWAWVVMLASFGTFFVEGGMIYAVGISHTTFLERFNQSVSLTSWAGALHSALLSLGGPLSSAIVDRYSCRTAIVISGFCYISGFLATAFVPNIEAAIFTFGILAGCGGAIGYTANVIIVGFNFHEKRSIALAISCSGVGLGISAMSPIMQLSRDYYGNVGFFIILAALSANVITFGMLCFPSQLELNAKHRRKQAALENTNLNSGLTRQLFSYKQALSNKAVLCLCFCMLNYGIGPFIIYLHLPAYIEHTGFSDIQAASVLSISGILSIISRVATGFLSSLQLVDDIVLFSGSMMILSISTILLPLYANSYLGYLVYGLLLGLSYGACYVVYTSVNISIIGVNYMSAAIGMEFFFCGLGSIIGPVLAGIIVDSGGTYGVSFVVAGSCIMLSAVSSALTVFFRKSKNNDTSLTISPQEDEEKLALKVSSSGKKLIE